MNNQLGARKWDAKGSANVLYTGKHRLTALRRFWIQWEVCKCFSTVSWVNNSNNSFQLMIIYVRCAVHFTAHSALLMVKDTVPKWLLVDLPYSTFSPQDASCRIEQRETRMQAPISWHKDLVCTQQAWDTQQAQARVSKSSKDCKRYWVLLFENNFFFISLSLLRISSVRCVVSSPLALGLLHPLLAEV